MKSVSHSLNTMMQWYVSIVRIKNHLKFIGTTDELHLLSDLAEAKIGDTHC